MCACSCWVCGHLNRRRWILQPQVNDVTDFVAIQLVHEKKRVQFTKKSPGIRNEPYNTYKCETLFYMLVHISQRIKVKSYYYQTRYTNKFANNDIDMKKAESELR